MNQLISVLTVGLALGAGPVHAQQSQLGVGEERPWARNVSLEKQKAADVPFQKGNRQWQNGL
ncbi:MAG TPA: hypothetical protein VF815_31990, partial [Myxococcaceae bacterium]